MRLNSLYIGQHRNPKTTTKSNMTLSAKLGLGHHRDCPL